jgi:peptide/nickel transport system permease protein
LTFFLAKRFLTFVATLVAASLVVFVALEILPGDPAQIMMGINAPPEAVDALRVKLGLDQPPVERYFRWVGGLLVGDLGQSFTYSVPVSELLTQRIQLTIPLALAATLLSTLIGLPLGVFAASHHNRFGDYGIMSFGQLGIAVPNFWLAILLTLLFSIQLGWLPAGGFPGWDGDLWPALRSLILPTISLAAIQTAIFSRVMRSAVLEVLREDYVRTARAKGLSRAETLRGHVLRNAFVPVITVMGLELANLLVGTIVVEQVFYLPGLGRLVFQSITQLDLIVVKNVVIMLAAMVILVNFIVDVLYTLIDPRLRAHRT